MVAVMVCLVLIVTVPHLKESHGWQCPRIAPPADSPPAQEVVVVVVMVAAAAAVWEAILTLASGSL